MEKEFLEILNHNSNILNPLKLSKDTFKYFAQIVIKSPDLIHGGSKAIKNLIDGLIKDCQPEDIEMINA